MLKSNRTCAFFFLYLHTQALFPFSFQFFPRLGSVFAEDVGYFRSSRSDLPIPPEIRNEITEAIPNTNLVTFSDQPRIKATSSVGPPNTTLPKQKPATKNIIPNCFISLQLSILHPSCCRVCGVGWQFRDVCVGWPHLAV